MWLPINYFMHYSLGLAHFCWYQVKTWCGVRNCEPKESQWLFNQCNGIGTIMLLDVIWNTKLFFCVTKLTANTSKQNWVEVTTIHINHKHVLGCVHAYFAKAESAFWNADSKRRSKTPLIQAIVRAQVNRKGVYMTSFKRGYNVILRSCFHQNQRFALTTIVNAHFWAAFMLILRRRFETLIQNADPNARSRKYCS